jgi:hypothetical protein
MQKALKEPAEIVKIKTTTRNHKGNAVVVEKIIRNKNHRTIGQMIKPFIKWPCCGIYRLEAGMWHEITGLEIPSSVSEKDRANRFIRKILS